MSWRGYYRARGMTTMFAHRAKKQTKPYFPRYNSVPLIRDRADVDGINTTFNCTIKLGYTSVANGTTLFLQVPMNFLWMPNTSAGFNMVPSLSATPAAGSFHTIEHDNSLYPGWNERLKDFYAYFIYGCRAQLTTYQPEDITDQQITRWGLIADLSLGAASFMTATGIAGASSWQNTLPVTTAGSNRWGALKQARWLETNNALVGNEGVKRTIRQYFSCAKFQGESEESFRTHQGAGSDAIVQLFDAATQQVVGPSSAPVSNKGICFQIAAKYIGNNDGSLGSVIPSQRLVLSLKYYARLIQKRNVTLINNPNI